MMSARAGDFREREQVASRSRMPEVPARSCFPIITRRACPSAATLFSILLGFHVNCIDSLVQFGLCLWCTQPLATIPFYRIELRSTIAKL